MLFDNYSLDNKEVQLELTYIFKIPVNSRTLEQNQFIVKVLQEGRFMEKIKDQQSYLELVKKIEVEHFLKDDIVFSEGDKGDKFYIILKGEIEGYRSTGHIKSFI